MSTPVWIGLGSNLGDRRAILDDAIIALSQVPGVEVRAVSSYHETMPIGGPAGQGPFLNAAAHLETALDPYQLLAALQRIENQAGRVRVVRWGERTLDLDILIFGTKFLDTKELKLPHPRLALRRFVLGPLVEIAPQIVDTVTKRTIADLLANLDRIPRIVTLDGPEILLKQHVFQSLADHFEGFTIAEKSWEMMRDDGSDPRHLFYIEIEAKIETLRSMKRIVESNRGSWLIVDFSIESDFRHASSTNWWTNPPHAQKRFGQFKDHEKRMQLLAASADAVSATFEIILPDNDRSERKPGFSRSPQLWPDSNDPEAIIAEVLATCRGIAGV